MAASNVTVIERCARCLGDHDGIHLKPFTLKPKRCDYTHFAICPATEEPILITVEDDDEAAG